MKMLKLTVFAGLVLSSLCGYADDFKWALMGTNGLGQFHNGLAIASKSEGSFKFLYGAINRSGEIAIPYKFEEINEVYGGFTGGYCIASTEEGKGIINTKGEFIFGPSNDFDISRTERYPVVFKITDKATTKSALFYNGVLLTDYEWDYIYEDNYPFISLSTKDEPRKSAVINILTSDFFEGWNSFPMLDHILLYNDNNILYYTKDGERVSQSDLTSSSKGVEIYQDSKTKKYGLRKGNEIIHQPTLRTTSIYGPVWVNDIAVLSDSIDPQHKNNTIVFDANGNKIYNNIEGYISFRIGKGCLLYSRFSGDIKDGVLTLDGKEIEELRNKNAYEIADGWIYVPESGNSRLYSIRLGKFFPSYYSLFEGEIIKHDEGKDKYKYIINPETDKIYGPFDFIGDYSEGLIYAVKDKSKYFVTKNGVKYKIPSEWSVDTDGFSEGVCRVSENRNVNGYIYNPLGHEGYEYNQKSVDNDKYIIAGLFRNAEEAFRNKEYGKAKELYYHIMMADPMNMPALNSYASCLYNLGYYEEALSANEIALSYESNNDFANRLHSAIIKAIENENHNSEYEEVKASSSIWDALANFGVALSNAAAIYSGNMNGGGDLYYGGGDQYYGGGNLDMGSGNAGTNSSNGNYVEQYRNWERIAERHYNSITNLGSSARKKDGSKSGSAGQGMSSSNYNRMKRSYREAQREMSRIRQQASRKGINIPQSKWETNQISY